MTKLCTKCRLEKPASEFYRRARAKSGLMSECKECHEAWHRANYPNRRRTNAKHRARLRSEALAAMGGACLRCGIDDPRVLHIDHIMGGGRQEKRAIGDSAIHRKIIAGETETYQLLCANCHNIKTWYPETDPLFAEGISKPNIKERV